MNPKQKKMLYRILAAAALLAAVAAAAHLTPLADGPQAVLAALYLIPYPLTSAS